MINQADLDAMLARNPAISIDENKTGSQPRRKRDKPKRASTLVNTVQRAESGAQRPIVRFVVYRVRLLDPDNNARSCKDLLDGLRYAQILSDDTKAKIDFSADQEKVKNKVQERTEIEIIIS